MAGASLARPAPERMTGIGYRVWRYRVCRYRVWANRIAGYFAAHGASLLLLPLVREGESGMSAITDPLVMDLVEWVAVHPRPYDEVIDAWRTSCPRLTVWEDAIDRGLISRRRAEDKTLIVQATSEGLRLLRESGRSPPDTRTAN